jgi:DNA-directed RNA polymerase specialized sigma24 family protein
MMLNWARWTHDGASIDVAMSGAYTLEARGTRADASMPLLNGEALDVDKAVRALKAELLAVVKEHWLRKGSARQKAKKCRCAIATFYRRLDEAHARIRVHLDDMRERGRRAGEAYRNRCLIPLRG